MRNSIAIAAILFLLAAKTTGQQQQQAQQHNSSCPLVAQTLLDNGLILRDVANLANSTITLQLIYEGQAWLGLGPSVNGQMVGSDAVIGLPDEANSRTNPGLYQMTSTSNSGVTLYGSFYQTLQNASIEQNDTHTVLTFTRSLEEAGQLTISPTNYSTWIYAVGRSNAFPAEHGMKGSITFLFTACGSTNTTVSIQGRGNSSDHRKWVAHGVLMSVAWGILVPIAIGASLLRDGLDRLGFPKGTWFTIHRTCNVLAVLATITGFWVAYATIEQESAQHFEITHMKVGLAIFIIAVVQAIVAFVRPALPHHHHHHHHDKTLSDEGDPHMSTTGRAAEGAAPEEHPVIAVTSQAHRKSLMRLIWESKHRVFGLVLLGLSWYNCQTGFDALVNLYGDSNDKAAAFWGVTAGISGLVVILTVFLRLVWKGEM